MRWITAIISIFLIGLTCFINSEYTLIYFLSAMFIALSAGIYIPQVFKKSRFISEMCAGFRYGSLISIITLIVFAIYWGIKLTEK